MDKEIINLVKRYSEENGVSIGGAAYLISAGISDFMERMRGDAVPGGESSAECGSTHPLGGPGNATGCGGAGIAGNNKMSVLMPSLTESELATLMWTVNALVSAEVRALRSEVYRLLLASHK